MKNLMRIILTCILGLLSLNVQAKPDRIYKFWVEFKDKSGSKYSILKPWDFLSDRALQRRSKANYAVTIDDLPVSQVYTSILADSGVRVSLTSKWMNAVLIQTTDSLKAVNIGKLYFVKKVTLMGIWGKTRGATAGVFDEFVADLASEKISLRNKPSSEEYNFGYGKAWNQTRMLGVQKMHDLGFKGLGVWIAVLDAGFYRADQMEVFDSLFLQKRVIATRDFVDFDGNVYNDDDHGTQVLSCMAANAPGVIVGTAPLASYVLIRTEDPGSEFPVEEAQWIAGAEFADSIGVDVLNSSLGYTTFDFPAVSHKYSDLNGHTLMITRAANMAWDRGIIVVNSAGNEGGDEWNYIGAPADAAGVIAVAAVDFDGKRAYFSSQGPTYDKRMKPDLAALGQRAAVATTNGYVVGSNGTSFASPILAGAIACFVQSAQSLSPTLVREMIYMSADNYIQRDSFTGMGIPDFAAAMEMLNVKMGQKKANDFIQFVAADTLYKGFEVKMLKLPAGGLYTYKLTDKKGKQIAGGTLYKFNDLMYSARFDIKYYGEYTLEIKDDASIWKKSFYFAKNQNE